MLATASKPIGGWVPRLHGGPARGRPNESPEVRP
jgi:hypothetical protein